MEFGQKHNVYLPEEGRNNPSFSYLVNGTQIASHHVICSSWDVYGECGLLANQIGSFCGSFELQQHPGFCGYTKNPFFLCRQILYWQLAAHDWITYRNPQNQMFSEIDKKNKIFSKPNFCWHVNNQIIVGSIYSLTCLCHTCLFIAFLEFFKVPSSIWKTIVLHLLNETCSNRIANSPTNNSLLI